jgi:hypothetical protein
MLLDKELFSVLSQVLQDMKACLLLAAYWNSSEYGTHIFLFSVSTVGALFLTAVSS